jgi:hypothetical protein
MAHDFSADDFSADDFSADDFSAETSHQRWHTLFLKCNKEDYLSLFRQRKKSPTALWPILMIIGGPYLGLSE